MLLTFGIVGSVVVGLVCCGQEGGGRCSCGLSCNASVLCLDLSPSSGASSDAMRGDSSARALSNPISERKPGKAPLPLASLRRHGTPE